MIEKILFIGGNGHHYVQQILNETGTDHYKIAVASDGQDTKAARNWYERWANDRVVEWFDDATVALDQFKPELVSIGAVYAFNGPWAETALRRGLPAIADKPIAATWEQLNGFKKMYAGNPSMVLLTEFDFRARRPFLAAAAAVSAGQIGDTTLATAQKTYRYGTRPAWYADRASYPGTLMWVGSHGIDAIEWIGGKKITRVVGHGGNLSRPGMGAFDDHVTILGELEGGGSCIASADLLRPSKTPSHGDDRVRVTGTKGAVEVREGRCTLLGEDGQLIDITEEIPDPPPVGRVMFDAICGKPSKYFGTKQSLETAAMLLAARDAADRGEWVTVPRL